MRATDRRTVLERCGRTSVVRAALESAAVRRLAVATMAVAFACAAVALQAPRAAVDLAGVAAVECSETTITSVAQADSWVDENSPLAAKGSDSILSVDSGSLNVDTGEASGRARAFVRFELPQAIPAGCVLEFARLQVFSSEGTVGTRVEVARLASSWSENAVSWLNQPNVAGAGVTSWSREGYMQWNVTGQVVEMLETGNHGFRIRDAAEASEAGGGHGFYAKEKGENPARLVIGFAPPSEEPEGPPSPPVPAAVSCGEVVTQSTLVTNDLSGCPGDGLVIGEPMIIVDLGGHTIDGVGLGSGVRNDGHASVTIRNGTIQEFDYGVNLLPEVELNLIERLTLLHNEVGAIELFDVAATEVRDNLLHENGGGISLVSGTRGSIVAGNTVTANGKAGLFLRDADGNRLEGNSVSGGGDLGIGLEHAAGNTLVGNTVSENSDGAIELRDGSHGNRVEDNTVVNSGDHGILVDASDRNELVGNTSHFMSDSGISLESANDGVVRGNDVRFNTGGLQVDGSSRNVIEANDASTTSGIGIELGGGSFENTLVGNVSRDNGSTGILIADDAADALGVPIPGLGNLLVGNVAEGNRADGIVAAKGGHTLTANIARDNAGWGINAASNSIDGGLNVATVNMKPEQCVGVVCKVEWNPPETTIAAAPSDPSSSRAATFLFASSDDTTPAPELRFECRLDEESAWATCSSPHSYTGLAEGSHVFEVRSRDLFDNVDPTPARHDWTVDVTPPETVIDAGPNVETASTSASFAFSSDEDGSFECSLDGGLFSACASPQSYGGLALGVHRFEVRAIDAAGNVDATPVSYGWTIVEPVDATAPETTIDSGPDASTLSTSAVFAFSASEPARFECSLDGGAFLVCGSPAEYTSLALGAHRFEVRATDLAGNVDASPASYEWTIVAPPDTTAPETLIDSGPDVSTVSVEATFSFSSEEGAGFECSLDGAAFAACVSPQSYGGLELGVHRFEVRAIDAAGNVDASPASYEWTIVAPPDTVAPETVIDSGPDAETTNTNAVFAFSASEPARFECALDGGPFLVCGSPAEYTSLALGAHRFEVRATDLAGNTDASPASYEWTVVAPPDVTAPETVIDSGPEVSTASTDATFSFSSEPGASFECSLDGAAFAACASPQAYGGLGLGAHRFEVRATDAAGNVDASPASYEWTVVAPPDVTAPETLIDSGPDASTESREARFTFSSEEGAGFECSLDGAAFAACVSPQSYGGLGLGNHRFEVRATDAAGNTDATPAAYEWSIVEPPDTAAPETAIDSGPDAETASRDATFTFSSEPGASFECSLDGAAFAGCSSPQSYGGLGLGVHRFEVRAIDVAGNTDASPASYEWTVVAPTDVTAPETVIDSGPDASTTSTSAVLAFSANELGVSFECSLDGDSFAACVSPQSYEGLALGAHRFQVRATDPAGNTDTSPASHEWVVVEPPDTTAPETAIDSGPDASTTSTTALFSFSSEPGARFECALDGGAFLVCGSPAEYTSLALGEHRFEVRATDLAGNTDATPASYGWTVVAPPDVTAPETVIDSGPDVSTASTDASFTFSSEEGAGFECSLDGAAFAGCSSPQSYGGLGLGVHRFEVRATDLAGNTDASPAAYDWTVVAPPDVTAPETAIDSGPDPETASTSASFAFSSEPGASFECSLDGSAFAACSSPQSYDRLALGAHDFEVRATDAAGNTDPTPAAYQWRIVEPPDTAAPETAIDSGPDVSTTSTSAVLAFSADELGVSFECSLDGSAFVVCSSPHEYTGLAIGAHRFEVRAIDVAGNTDASPAAHEWTIVAPPDVTAPETTIDSAPAGTTTSMTAVFAFSADEAGSTFECSLDGAPFAACVSPQSYEGLALGAHRFEVRATDAAGNTDASPAVHAWTVVPSAVCPSVMLVASADSWVDENSATNNFGSDSILKVRSKGPRDNFRALVRFVLPAVPQGCRVQSARLRLFAASARSGRVLHALRVAAEWSESLVTWNTQPGTAGPPAEAASGTGARDWDVTSHLQAMLDTGTAYGFLIKDADESADAEQSFHSREKGESPPQLAIVFAPAEG